MRVSLLFVSLMGTSVLHVARAWGKTGHEMVANIAWNRLSRKVQTFVIEILGTSNNTFDSPLAAVADWADRVRYTSSYHWTTPLHFVDVHDDEIPGGCPSLTPNKAIQNTTNCIFEYTRDCENDACVAGAIANYSNILSHGMNKNLRGDSSAWRLKESLMFVTHFVGDIHQPLHCARKSDKGGNTFHVHFNVSSTQLKHKKEEWNLHSVWDDGIIDRALLELYNQTRENFESDLIELIDTAETTGDIQAWLSCSDGRNKTCTTSWGQESLTDARVWAYRNADDTEVVDGSTISKRYYDSRLGVVQRRIAAAGVRLAATLEQVLDNKSNSPSFGELVLGFIRQAQS